MFNPPENAATVQPLPGCTLAAYAAAKQLPENFLSSLGLKDITYDGRPAIRIPYLGEDKAEVAVRFRTALTKSEHSDERFRWKSGAKPLPYGLWRLEATRRNGSIVIVEGESDAQTLWFHDISALGIPGAAVWKETWADYLEGIARIYVVIEADSGGESVRQWIGRSRIRDRVWLMTAGPWKDVSGLYLTDPNGFKVAWQAVLDKAVPWQDSARHFAERDRQEWAQTSSELARDPDILSRFEEAMVRYGVVGESRAVRLLYLAMTSRLLDRPVSLVLKAPPSTGKSHLVQSTLEFFPPRAYYEYTAMSERALAYSEEPLEHRIIVVYEAVGLSSETGGYLMRSLLSEGRLKYVTVDKTSGGMKSRSIDKEGPTGLILTTTAIKLRPDDETRMLSIPVTDTPEQTRRILVALASEDDREVNLEQWHALQEWLAVSETRVTIPCAKCLAEKIDPTAPRLRRDFKLILNLIKAHAILHQLNRERDASGRIIATLKGYVAVRELVEDLVAEGVECTVRATVRETVFAVKAELEENPDCHVQARVIVKRLNLHKTVVSRRVRAAIEGGYLRNEEERPNRPAKLVLGDPLPEEKPLLPTVEELSGCMVASNMEGVDTPPARAVAIDDAGFNWSTGIGGG